MRRVITTLASPLNAATAPGWIYFLAYAAIYSSYCRAGRHLYDVWGVSLSGQGHLALVACACAVVGSACVTAIADATRRHESVLRVCALCYAASFALLALDPAHVGLPGSAARYWYACAANAAAIFFSSAMFPLVNHTAARIARRDSALGSHMMWASVGQGAACALVSSGVVLIGEAAMFAAVGTCSLALCAVLTVCARNMPHLSARPPLLTFDARPVRRSDDGDTGPTIQAPTKTRWASSRAFGLFGFLVLVLVSGTVRAIVAVYLPFQLRAAHASESTIGTVLALRVVYDAAAFAACDAIAARFGLWHMFSAGFALAGARCLLYTYMPPSSGGALLIAYALFVEMLKGGYTALTVYAGTRIARRLATAGHESTTQGLYSGIYGGLSTALGGAIGWHLLQHIPTGETRPLAIAVHHRNAISTLFGIAATASLAAWPLCAAFAVFV